MFRIFLIFIFIFINITSSLASDASESSFKTGVKFFKQKNYKSALSFFNKAHSQGMEKSSLYFNIGASYYKLGHYNKAKINFIHISNDNKFRQIAYFNLGLIAEKMKQRETAIDWYKKSAEINRNKKITILANNKLDSLLSRRKYLKINSSVALSLGSDDNVTNAASTSPSNKSDNYLELFAYIKAPINSKINFIGTLYTLNYRNLSTENFMFYSAGLDYSMEIESWKITPEFSLAQSTYNNTSFQNIADFKINGKRNLNDKAKLDLRYRYSNINSQNTAYNYLQGSRHQFRADYKKKIKSGRLRFRYQLEINNRQNTSTANYSPTRNTLRARLKHKLNSSWNFSEEIAYRISDYDAASGIARKDSRFRLRIISDKKINTDWLAGIRYTYTDNNSNISTEKYVRNNIQIFTRRDF